MAQVRNANGRCSGSMPAVFRLALASSKGMPEIHSHLSALILMLLGQQP